MKNMLLILLVLTSLSVMAFDKEPKTQHDAFSQAVFNKSPASSLILDKTKGSQNKNQCVINCLNAYSACIATAQGSAEVRHCENVFEDCMVDCGI